MTEIETIIDALIAGDQEKLTNLVENAVKAGADADEILNDGLIKGMDIVGEKMGRGDMFIPEVLRCAKIMNAAIDIIRPYLQKGGCKAAGKVVLGTVKGDLHDIGKNLVMMMMESSGFEIIDLGVDVTPEAFVNAAKKNNANIVGLSALLTTTMPIMKHTIEAFVAGCFRDQVKIIIGGAPITQQFSDEIGADGYAQDAGSATKLAKQLVGEKIFS